MTFNDNIVGKVDTFVKNAIENKQKRIILRKYMISDELFEYIINKFIDAGYTKDGRLYYGVCTTGSLHQIQEMVYEEKNENN